MNGLSEEKYEEFLKYNIRRQRLYPFYDELLKELEKNETAEERNHFKNRLHKKIIQDEFDDQEIRIKKANAIEKLASTSFTKTLI